MTPSPQHVIGRTLRQAGAIGTVRLVVCDSAAAEVAALKKKHSTVLIAQDPRREGEISVEIAKQILDGSPVDKVAMAEATRASESVKTDPYDYKSDCSLSH